MCANRLGIIGSGKTAGSRTHDRSMHREGGRAMSGLAGQLWVASVGDHRWAVPVPIIVALVEPAHWHAGRDPRTGMRWDKVVDARAALSIPPRVAGTGIGLLWRHGPNQSLVAVDALEYLWTPPREPEPDCVWQAVAPAAWHSAIYAAYRLGTRWVWQWRSDWPMHTGGP